jgi:hypothetical protein
MLLNLSLLHEVGRFMPFSYVYDSVDTSQTVKKGNFQASLRDKLDPKTQKLVLLLLSGS